MSVSAEVPVAGRSNPVGLCATCRHMRMVRSARGSQFFLCQLSESDTRFAKYPRLPVLKCTGYAAVHSQAPEGLREPPGSSVSAVILAAGQSRRMGRNKLLLPYGASTVVETVIARVLACPAVGEVVVVTGHEPERLAALLAPYPVRCVFNPAYDRAEMFVSLQTGLRALSGQTSAALLVLGDQPRLQSALVQRVIAALQSGAIVIPSYQMKRGHPIGLGRTLWAEVLALPETATLRDFLRTHEAHIRYVLAEDDSVLKDVDTPEDYQELLAGEKT